MYPPGIENLLRIYWLFAVIMLTLALIALLVGIVKWRKGDNSRTTLLIVLYLLALLFQGFLSMSLAYWGHVNGDHSIDALSGNIFMIVEFLIFNILFFNMVRSPKARTVIKCFVILFPIICIIYWTRTAELTKDFYTLSVLEIFYLISICLVYFYELFSQPPTRTLTKEKDFWIATGTLFYLVCSVPSFLILQFISAAELYFFETIQSISLLVSGCLNLFFIKALLCKTKQETLSPL
ncbi:hypothetical protein [Flavitalea sp.]|nr:hypothetical protein [Flavitalea sp.]